ncbi:MAG: hypothetical protein JJD92_01285 [Frankiaceae bacterium]|nr:hypothetical protein [Frankiaceae bacterium]
MPVPVSRRLRLALVAALLLAMGGGLGSTPALAASDPSVISRSGATLMLHGHAYRFTGVNAYQLGTYWSVNAGCGQQLSTAQLDAFFGSLRADSVVRFWAFQAQGVNRTTKRIDYTGLDRVFRAAERHQQRLIPVLGNQGGGCDDGHWKDAAWYAGGYAKRFNDDGRGLNPVSYAAWVTSTVTRYKGSPALGMWEPVNEPEATNCAAGFKGGACYQHQICPTGAAATLRSFFDKVGAQIKRLDPKHLIASGLISSGQCGARATEWVTVHGSPYVDVATYHDYGQDSTAVPGDLWNGMATRLKQAAGLKKPLFTEEVGIMASTNHAAGCTDPSTRSTLLGRKLTGQLAAGSRGFLPWFWVPTQPGGCLHDISASDPMMRVLARVPL